MKHLKTFESFDSELGKNLKKHLDIVVKELSKIYPKSIENGKIKIEIIEGYKNKYGELMPELEIETNNMKVFMKYDYSNNYWVVSPVMIFGGGVNIENHDTELKDTIDTIKYFINITYNYKHKEKESTIDTDDEFIDDTERNRLNNQLTSMQKHYHSR
jgi:hypothetical protein